VAKGLVKITVFLNQLGLGGTEKAAARWAQALRERGHELRILSLQEGARRREFEDHGMEVRTVSADAESIRDQLRSHQADVIHTHAPGHPHPGDILGEALVSLPKKIPVLQTNIFGQSLNPKEDAWTDFRLYISWTSCVQAARRSFHRLDAQFFKNRSVAVYPLETAKSPPQSEIQAFRSKHGVGSDEVLLGRLSRPEPNKWTDLPIQSFRIAARANQRLKLLLREPPAAVAQALRQSADRDRFIILSATTDPLELALTMSSLDVVLHTSSIGESFGYGIAEPMNYGKPVIANSTPWLDQAQIELVRHGECGFIASTAQAMAQRVLQLANDAHFRSTLGSNAQKHIRQLADPVESTNRLEAALGAVAAGLENPRATEDLIRAQQAADYLDSQQFGHSFTEQIALRPLHYRVRFHEWRRTLRRTCTNAL
jgi:glycosyltransferase involved in cell wall biosynthesis